MTDTSLPDDDVGTQFDPDQVKEKQKRVNDLKKNNIKAVFSTGPGRLALVFVVIAMVTLVIIGAVNIFKKRPPPQTTEPGVGANAVLSVPHAGDPVATSDYEARMRQQNITAQAEAAKEEGRSYIPPPILREEQETALPKPSQTPPAEQSPIVDTKQSAAGPDPNQLAALKEERNRIKSEQVMPQVMTVLGKSDNGQPRSPFGTSYYDLPNRNTPQQQLQTASLGTNTNSRLQQGAVAFQGGDVKRGKPLIQAGDGYYCELDNPINTNSARTDVFATCYQGVVDKAKAVCKWERSPESSLEATVTVFCNTLAIPGKPSLPIQAVAFDESTNLSGMADDVNYHSFQRYGGLFVASLLRGLGNAASMVTGSTTTVSNGGVAITQTQTDPIDTNREVKIALGEVGKTFADSLQRRSDMIKPTVKVGSVYDKNEKKGVRLVFLADVYEEKK